MRKTLFVGLALLSRTVFAGGDVASLARDGRLNLYHSHSEETIEVVYEKDGQLIPEAMARINYFMRSRDEGAEKGMNPDLIRLLDHLEDHFGARTLEIICGYRSPGFNKKLKESGRNVARESYHMEGIAADIHIDEVPEKMIADYLRRLNFGGVGYYPDLLMVHADLGLKRFWQENKFTDRTNIGLFNEASPFEARTDHLFYFEGDRQILRLSNADNPGLVPTGVALEWFSYGAWRRIASAGPSFLDAGGYTKIAFSPASEPPEGHEASLPEPARGTRNVRLPYGKFRWKILTQNGRDQYSNEFYLKRR